MFNGTLAACQASHENREHLQLFDLEIKVKLKQVGAEDLNAILQGIASAVGVGLGRDRASFHLNVEPVAGAGLTLVTQ